MLVGITLPEQRMYDDVSRFARERYAEKLSARINANADVFAHAWQNGRVVGCFGMYLAERREPLLIERYVPHAFEKIAGETAINRRMCAELGTRAVDRIANFRGTDVSLALSATLLLHAKSRGLQYLGFTSNRTVRGLGRALGVNLVELGEPDLSLFDKAYRENWETFFRLKQRCFGIRLASPNGCIAATLKLEQIGIQFTPACPTPA